MWERMQQFDSRRPISDAHRFEEVYSDEEEDNLRNGVLAMLDPKKRSVSDELYFADGRSRYPVSHSGDYEDLAYGEEYNSSEDEDEDDYDTPRQRTPVAVRSQELLAEKALERIQRAKAKGKPNVTLSHEELEALEQRRGSASDSPERKRSSPAKGSPARSSSTNAWTRRRSKSNAPAPSVVSSKKRSSKDIRGQRKDSPEEAAYTTGAVAPPGFMIPGPGGAPVYSPLGYYDTQPAPKSSRRRSVSEQRASPPLPNSRSTSSGSRRGPPPAAYDTRGYGSNRNYTDPSRTPPLGYEPDYSRSRNSLNAPYPIYASDDGRRGADQYPYSTRRVASGPAEVSYGHVPRRPVSSNMSNSDPALGYRRGPSGLNNEYDLRDRSESEDEDEDEDESADELAGPEEEPRFERRPHTTSNGARDRRARRR